MDSTATGLGLEPRFAVPKTAVLPVRRPGSGVAEGKAGLEPASNRLKGIHYPSLPEANTLP